MTHIEVFADIVCPFTHVGLRRLHTVRAARGSRADVRVRAWPLEWINGAPIAADVVAREIEGLRAEVAPDLFAGFDPKAFPRTSLAAFGLAAAAYGVDMSVGEAVSLTLRDAVFEDGRDVADPEVLRSIADAFDVTPIDDAAIEASVRDDWERGKALGVRGSPHLFAAGHDWFCPSLDIRHEGGNYEVHFDVDAMHDFYATALG
jgi:predicted DsbA family dithiol-disulfide isomerase